jgi:hypothetical protein
MKRMVSDVKAEKLAQELKDLETRGDDELKYRWLASMARSPSEDSPLSPDRGVCPPNAGECTGRTQIFGPPPSAVAGFSVMRARNRLR